MFYDQDIQVQGLYRHGTVEQLPSGLLYLSMPERLPWQQRNDTVIYHTKEAEYLFDIVAGHYSNIYPFPWFLTEVVAQFQPTPIIDPSVPLPDGYELQLPSSEYIETIALGESLGETPEL